MYQKRNLTIVAAFVIGWLLFASCTPQATLPAVTPSATPTEMPAPTSTILTTLIPTAAPTPTPAGLPKGPGAVWRLVVLSDSQGWGLGAAYASQIEKDMSVKVTVGDFAIGNLKSREVLEVLETGKSANLELEKLPAALKEADVVVMLPFDPTDSVDPVIIAGMDSCGISSTPKNTCTPQAFIPYTATLKTLWAKILELRAGKPTILRALDYYNPFVASWKEHQNFDACTTCWENLSLSARQAAEAYHIPFLSRYDAFNGAKHDENPKQKGYFGPDGMHPNDKANQFSAELLAKMGYEPVPQP